MTTGIWADAEGRHTYIGEMSMPLADQPWADILKFLETSGFTERETTGLPSSTGAPYSESTWEQRDRVVRLTQRLSPYGFPVIASASTSEGDGQSNPAPLNTIGDLVKFVTMGRSSTAPERESILNESDPVSTAIGSVYSAKAFAKIGLAVQKWYPGCGTMGHTKKEEGCALCEELGPTAGILPTGVKPAEVAKGVDQSADVYRGQAQDPVSGGNTYMEQGSDQSRAMGRDGSLNPMYGGQQTPKVTFEEIMQSPAYTSDDGLDIWNTYRQEDLEPPDEIQITLDPISGEVMQTSYSNPDAEQLPFLGTPAMPINPFAGSPKPTPMTEEAPQKQTGDVSNTVAGQRPQGMGGAQMGQPHAQPQVPAPSTSQPSQSQPQKQPSQPSQPEQASKPQTLSPDQLMQTPQTPQWTSPDPSSSEEASTGQSNQGQKQPSPNIQLQRSFRKFSRYGK